ncbi:MAG: hypothetical protein SGARI_003957, partial [Bacillariaceae sp.]
MNPWWDVKTKDLISTDPGAFAEAISLEATLKNLCEESHSYLQQALPEEYRQSPWLTPLGMARLIGSLEQNCLGIRRKHAVHRNIMEDANLRQEMHRQIVSCLEKAGMIGDEVEEDDDAVDDSGGDAKEENAEERSDGQDGRTASCQDEWDYSCDDIAQFLAGFPTHEKVDMEDEWDEVFRPLDGTAHFSVASKMNHSCDPNVLLMYKTRGWGRNNPLVAYCVALRDISEGEEMTICYIDASGSLEERQNALANYGFKCTCPKCNKEKNGNEETETDACVAIEEDNLFGSDDDDSNG